MYLELGVIVTLLESVDDDLSLECLSFTATPTPTPTPTPTAIAARITNIITAIIGGRPHSRGVFLMVVLLSYRVFELVATAGGESLKQV